MSPTLEEIVFWNIERQKMKNETEFTKQAEAYLQGTMGPEETAHFEQMCAADPELARHLEMHRLFLTQLVSYGRRKDFKESLAAAGEKFAGKQPVHRHSDGIRPILHLWNRFKVNAMVAAAVAVFAVFSTLWLSGYYSNVKDTTTQYSALKRDVNTIRRNVNAQNALIKHINNTAKKKDDTNYIHYGATGFALSPNGYILTTYHVIKGAESVYVQNVSGESYKAKVLFQDPAIDMAILQVVDSGFKALTSLPYTFKQQHAEVGEDVFTIGFPREDAVYGQGYISSKTGYGGDTTSYQVSIPVNPGNSGGPLLDSKGNIIGIISGKQTETDGAAFAIKSNYLLRSIATIPTDSLDRKLSFSKKNNLAGLTRQDQIKKLESCLYIVKAY